MRKNTQLHASQIFIKIFIASWFSLFPVKIYPYNKYCYLGDTLYISKNRPKAQTFSALSVKIQIKEEVYDMEFKDRLKALRKEKKLTQVKLGEMLNYGYTAIANYESGRNQPSISDLKKIASIFNVSMDYLLGVNDIRYPYVIDDETAAFNEFRRYYTLLEEDSKADLLLYMEFLVERQNRMKAIPDLKYEDYELKNTIQKAAQKPVAYRKE